MNSEQEKPNKTYRMNSVILILYAILGVFSSLFTLGSIIMMILIVVQTPNFSISSEDGRLLFGAVFYVLIVGFFSYVIMRMVIFYNSLKIDLYLGGFLYSHFGRKVFCKWADIKSLLVVQTGKYIKRGDRYEVRNVRVAKFIIERYDGVKLNLGGNLTGFVGLSNKVMENTYPRLIDEATQNYIDNKNLPFGNVLVNREDGLFIEGNWVSWAMIRCIQDKMWLLEVQFKDPSRSIRISSENTPNFYVLRELLRSQGLLGD